MVTIPSGLRASATRVLGTDDMDAAWAVLNRDPVANCFIAARLETVGLDRRRLGAEVWGYETQGRLSSLCYSGANLIPAGADLAAAKAFAARARRQGRRCSSLVGPSEAVSEMWRVLLPAWGEARDVRLDQPLLALDRPPRIRPEPRVRPVRPDELDLILPACIAMFTEEVGVSPLSADGGSLYRARVSELIGAGRSYALIEGGRVLFKAELGAVAKGACQVQGVWVDPAVRGRGLSAPGMASVAAFAMADHAPVVSLYVNDYNIAARKAYDRVGFRPAGTLASILF